MKNILWQSGKKLIPTRESASYWGPDQFTTAQVFNNNATNLLSGVVAKIKQSSPINSEFLSIGGRWELTAQLYRELLELLEVMPHQRLTMELRPK